jgi:hypothetical protein
MAPLVAFPLVLVGFAVLVGGALAVAWRLPRVRCGKWPRRAVTAMLFIAAVPVIMWSSSVASNAMVIILAYGYDAYAAGLWIINKHGDLNNGGNIGDFWHGVWGALMFLSFAWPMLPLVVFRFITDRPEERAATTGEALYYRGLVRQNHGLYASALEDYQTAIGQLTSFLEYMEREATDNEWAGERIEQVKEHVLLAREGIVQCEERMGSAV